MEKKAFRIKKSKKGIVIIQQNNRSERRRHVSKPQLAIECFDEKQVQRIMSIQERSAVRSRSSKISKVISVLKNNAIVSVVKEIRMSKH